MGVLAYSNIHRMVESDYWGDMSDGTYSQSGGAVTITGRRDYSHCTLDTAATFGPTERRVATIYVRGLLRLEDNSETTGTWGVGGTGMPGGASRNTVGVGNNGTDYYPSAYEYISDHIVAAGSGGGGGGGGGAVNAGGDAARSVSYGTFPPACVYSITAPAGTGAVGNGADGSGNLTQSWQADLDYEDHIFGVSTLASGGGGGGIDSIGTGATTGTSGAGGNGGDAGGYIHIRAQVIMIEAGSSINADGGDGSPGSPASDSTNTDADCGGGGGGGGGAGGGVWILTRSIDNPALVTADGGAGGAPGAGVGTGGTGGTGGDGPDGIVAVKVLSM